MSKLTEALDVIEDEVRVDALIKCPGEFTPYRNCITGYDLDFLGNIRLIGTGCGRPDNKFTHCPYCGSKIGWGI